MNKYISLIMRIFSIISAITMVVLAALFLKPGYIGRSSSPFPPYIMLSFISTGLFLALSKLTDDKDDK